MMLTAAVSPPVKVAISTPSPFPAAPLGNDLSTPPYLVLKMRPQTARFDQRLDLTASAMEMRCSAREPCGELDATKAYYSSRSMASAV